MTRPSLHFLPTFAAIAAAAFAQTPRAEFEVASIKPNPAGDNRVSIQMAPGGRWIANNVTIKMLIQQAYNVKDFQITGAPAWLSSERFDINAKAEGASAPEQIRPMLQSLLADRFQLKIQRDSREMPVYALVVGKNGSKLQPSSGAAQGPNIHMGRGLINGQGITPVMLASQKWTPELGQGPGGPSGPGGLGGPGGPGGREGGPPPDASGPSIFTAVQEQLGLSLEAQKGSVEMLIIEKIERPTEN